MSSFQSPIGDVLGKVYKSKLIDENRKTQTFLSISDVFTSNIIYGKMNTLKAAKETQDAFLEKIEVDGGDIHYYKKQYFGAHFSGLV